MPKARSPERDRAYEIYKESNGLITLREIASRLGVPEKSVSGWKCKDSWDKKINGVLQSNIRSTPKRKKVAKKIIEDVENNEELNDRERLFILHIWKRIMLKYHVYELAMTSKNVMRVSLDIRY